MKYLPFLLLLPGCETLQGLGGYTARAVAAGAGELVTQVPDVLDAAATGGWTAGALALALAVWKGTTKGLAVSRARRVKEVTEGVRKAK